MGRAEGQDPMNDRQWTESARKHLVGRTITAVRYQTTKEAGENGWFSRPIEITLDNGTTIVPMRDDEGNDAGAISVGTKDGAFLLPVLR
jgi:hypothetical protein